MKLLLFLVLLLRVAKTQGQALFQKPYPICVGSYWPVGECDNSGAQGYEVDVFMRAAALGLNWTRGVDYEFVCIPVSTIVGVSGDAKGALLDNTTARCFSAASGIAVTLARIDSGVRCVPLSIRTPAASTGTYLYSSCPPEGRMPETVILYAMRLAGYSMPCS